MSDAQLHMKIAALQMELCACSMLLHKQQKHPYYQYVALSGLYPTFDANKKPTGDGWEKNTFVYQDGIFNATPWIYSHWMRRLDCAHDHSTPTQENPHG